MGRGMGRGEDAEEEMFIHKVVGYQQSSGGRNAIAVVGG